MLKIAGEFDTGHQSFYRRTAITVPLERVEGGIDLRSPDAAC